MRWSRKVYTWFDCLLCKGISKDMPFKRGKYMFYVCKYYRIGDL